MTREGLGALEEAIANKGSYTASVIDDLKSSEIEEIVAQLRQDNPGFFTTPSQSSTELATAGQNANVGQAVGSMPVVQGGTVFTNAQGASAQAQAQAQNNPPPGNTGNTNPTGGNTSVPVVVTTTAPPPTPTPVTDTTLPTATAPPTTTAPTTPAVTEQGFAAAVNVKGNDLYHFVFDHNDGETGGVINVTSGTLPTLNVGNHNLGAVPITVTVPAGAHTATVKFAAGSAGKPTQIDGKLDVFPNSPTAVVNSGGSQTFRVVQGGSGVILNVTGAP